MKWKVIENEDGYEIAPANDDPEGVSFAAAKRDLLVKLNQRLAVFSRTLQNISYAIAEAINGTETEMKKVWEIR